MTKRLTIALVAVALFVLLAVMPASAALAANGTIINQGATIYIGEEGLNLTHAFNAAQGSATLDEAPTLTAVGWWASAAVIGTTSPSKTIDFGVGSRYKSTTVAPADFVGYTGNWYLLDAGGAAITPAIFSVADPSLDIKIWDFNQNSDVTGKSVPQGEKLGFRIDTNMYQAVDGRYRGNVIYFSGAGYPPTPIYQANNLMTDVTGNWTNTSATGDSCGCGCTGTSATYVYSNYSTGGNMMTFGKAGGAQGGYVIYWTPWYYDPATNMFYDDAAFTTPATLTVRTTADYQTQSTPSAATDGFIDLKIKDESNAQLNALYNADAGTASAGPNSVLKNFVNTQPFFWGSTTTFNWDTGALDLNGQYAYPVGTYTVSAESKLNKMKDNYKSGGADYTGKTVSQSYTVTLVSDTVKIEANKDSVVRSKTFSVTVTGRPSTYYYIWVKGTSTMDGTYDNQPPMAVLNQEQVYVDNPLGPYSIGSYEYENGAGKTISEDVSSNKYTWNGTRCYVMIKTSTSGTRTVEFLTTNWTKAQKYTIRVENKFGDNYKEDEVDLKVEKGAVTIVAAGDQSYYLGEEIKLSGTNTETYKTYLFIVGPNLKDVGSQIQQLDPRNFAVENNNASSFKSVDVNGDNTWSWKWGTSNYALDAGTYTIYAVSQPYDKDNLGQAAYGTVSIIIKKPFVSATASQSTVAKGDRIYITGTAEGDPSGVQIWIMGKNFYTKVGESVNSDASFKYEVRQETTKNLASGQYFVVVQHPMQNGQFDIDTVAESGTNVYVENMQLNAEDTTTPTKIFKLGGAGSLQGSDAAEALAEGINDANVDDTYTKLQFLIEEPIIRVDTIGDKHVGDKFTITAQTNLAVDDEILVQVYSSSFKPTVKSQSGEFSGATGTVKVAKGSSGTNVISFDVDSSTFKPDEYIVTESAVIQDATGTALFNVLDVVPTTVPTTVVTTAATTAPATTATTVAPPVTTTAKPSPGYGALIALIGLGAVALIVVRRH